MTHNRPRPDPVYKKKIHGKEGISAADIGCGGGRYDLLLLQNLPALHLTCIDVNRDMLQEAACYLKKHGRNNFSTTRAGSAGFNLTDNSLDCIFTFNAVHHFDPVAFLNQSAKALKSGGYVFIYTRLKSQNAGSIWGEFFPGFSEKEDRLYDLAQVEQWMDKAGSLTLKTIEFFKSKRAAPLTRLINQAEGKHYSTFSLYSSEEFNEALSNFEQGIRHHFPNPERIEWFDENVMLLFRKE